MFIDLIKLEHLAVDIAKAAGRLLMRYRHQGVYNTKSDQTVQTPADIAAERLLRRMTQAVLPDAGFLGEESYSAAPTDGLVWVCDPLDGTTNYLRGLPVWGVSLALLQDAAPIIGVVHLPLLRETYAASLGNGASRNGRLISTSSGSGGQFADVYSISSRQWADYALKGMNSTLRCLGSCAYHLALLASGRLVGVWEHNPKVWDIAAGVLLIKEAGGIVRSLDGAKYERFIDALEHPERALPTLAAANPDVLDRMLAAQDTKFRLR